MTTSAPSIRFGSFAVEVDENIDTNIAKAVALIEPIDEVHWDSLLAESPMNTDRAGMALLHNMGPGPHHGHLEAHHHQSTVVFQCEASKVGKQQADKMEKFKGVLQADAESRTNETSPNPDIVEAGRPKLLHGPPAARAARRPGLAARPRLPSPPVDPESYLPDRQAQTSGRRDLAGHEDDRRGDRRRRMGAAL